MLGFRESSRTNIAGKLSELGIDSIRGCSCFIHPALPFQYNLGYHCETTNREGKRPFVMTDTEQAGGDTIPTS